jgi:hypothetical protein
MVATAAHRVQHSAQLFQRQVHNILKYVDHYTDSWLPRAVEFVTLALFPYLPREAQSDSLALGFFYRL